MADYSIVQEALKRGYSLDEIANTLAEHDGLDPSIIRERGYSATDMLSKLGYEQPAPEPQKESGDFMRGAGEAFQQVPQLGYGLVAGAGALAEKVAGEGGIATGIKKTGVEGYQRWGEKVAEGAKESDSWTTSYNRAKEGDFGSLVDWFQHGLGYATGQGVQILATAGLGSLAAKGAGVGAMAMAKGMVAKEAARIAATKEGAVMSADAVARLATANIATKIGQNTAMAATAFGMEGGEIYGDLVSEAEKEGRELTGAELGKAFVATTGAGLLEFAGDKIGLDLMLGKKVLGMGGVGGRLVRGATGGTTGIIGEGLTEYAQTGVEEYGKGNESNPIPFMQSDKSHRQAIDAAALGAVGGGAMGGVGGILAPQQKNDKPAPTPSDILAAPDADTAIQSFTDSLDGADLLDEGNADQQPPTEPPSGGAPSFPSFDEWSKEQRINNQDATQDRYSQAVQFHNMRSDVAPTPIESGGLINASPITQEPTQPTQPTQEAQNGAILSGAAAIPQSNPGDGISAGVEIPAATGAGEIAAPRLLGLAAVDNQLAAGSAQRAGDAASVDAQLPVGAGGAAVGGAGQQATVSPIVQSLQNRNRNSKASILQMNAIAKDPNPRLLMASPTMENGAPVVTDLEGRGIATHLGNEDVVVTGKREIPFRYAVVDAAQLSSSNFADGTRNLEYAVNPDKLTAITNGRTAGVIKAYQLGTAEAYRQAIIDNAETYGLNREQVQGMSQPVMVRLIDASHVTESIGDESNTTSTLGLSAVEQARNDTGRVDVAALTFNENGTPTPEAMRGFIHAMPKGERQNLAPNGTPTKQAVDRILGASLWQAYGSEELVELAVQSTEPEARTVIAALSNAAPAMMKLEGAGDLDIRPLIVEAATAVVNAGRQGVSVTKLANQKDLAHSKGVQVVLDMFAQNVRSAKRITEILNDAATIASDGAAHAKAGDMFGGVSVTRQDVLRRFGNDTTRTQDLGQPGGNGAAGQNAQTGTADQAGRTGHQPTQEVRAADQGVPGTQQPERDYALESHTADDLKNRQARLDAIEKEKLQFEAELARQEKARLEHEDIKRRSEAAARTFALGQDAELNLSGQQSLFEKARHYDPNQLLLQLDAQPIRPGENTEQTRTDRAGLAASALLRGADGSLLGLSLATDWIAGKGSSLLGKRVTSPKDLATLGAVLRDPRAETFRYFLVKDGKIVYHTAVSSRMVGSTHSMIGEPEAFLSGIKATMERMGADGYYLMHNHPSRLVQASRADISTTEHIANTLPGFLGHVILDHTEFGLIEAHPRRFGNGGWSAVDAGSQPLNVTGQDPTRSTALLHAKLDAVISGPEALASMADVVRQPGNVVLVAVDGQMHVTGIMQVSRDSMKKGGISALKNLVRLRKAAGSTEVFAILPEGMKFDELSLDFTKRGWLMDVHISVAGRGVSAVERNLMAYQRGGAQGKARRGMVVDQPVAGYKQTDTPAFKAWFGDSKVVDADGKPLVVYHGSNAQITEFDKEKSKGGFWFSGEVSDAEDYGYEITSAYLSIKNPAYFERYNEDQGIAKAIKEAEVAGYDGLIVTSPEGGDVNGMTWPIAYVAFRPEQIKSATGNNGQFDPTNPSIVQQPYANYQADLFSRMEEAKNEEVAIAERKGSPQMDMFAEIYLEEKKSATIAKPAQEPTAQPAAESNTTNPLDGSMTPWEMDFGFIGKFTYRAQNPILLPDGAKLIASQIIPKKLTLSKKFASRYDLPSEIIYAFRNSIIEYANGERGSLVEYMGDNWRDSPTTALANFVRLKMDILETREFSSINNAARKLFEEHRHPSADLFDNKQAANTAPASTVNSLSAEADNTQEQQASAILDRANITGKDRLDIMRDFKDGKHSLEDMEKAYPMNVEAIDTSEKRVDKTQENRQVEQPARAKPQGALAIHKDTIDRALEGNINADEFKAAFDTLLENKAEIVAELEAMTKPEIFKQFPGIEYRYKSEKKNRLIDAAYRSMMDSFVLGDSIAYSMGQKYEDVIRGYVERTTDESLAEYADKVSKSREEREARRKDALAGMENPQTLEDYQRILSARAQEIGEGATFAQARMEMTPEQRAKFDELAAEKSRSERASRKVVQQEQSLRAPGETVETTEIIKTKHTKHGHDLWQFQMVQRVAPEEFKSLATQAKRLGGDYSSYRGNGAIPGWQFRTDEAAKAFKALVAGDTAQAKDVMGARRDAFADDRSQSAVERLTEMADALEEKADASLNQARKENTNRRAEMASRAETAARSDKALAQTMRNIAQAIQDGSAKFLDRIRQKVQVETLRGFAHTAQADMLRQKYQSYAEQEKHRDDPVTAEAADYATYPSYTAYRSDLANIGRALLEVDGTKKLGQQIMKVADDVSDAYQSFAKENLHRVSTFSKTGGGGAIFASKAEAEAVISRSGFNGQAIVLPFKRGQNIIIQSPSEAIKRGIWQGDNDKRITLHPDIGAELVEKMGKAARRGVKISVPWQLENAYDMRKRLAGMNIETPAELRAALREFIGLREAPKEADKIKQLERAMIGRRNDGMDFFPTPASVADEMVEAADIQEGMSVLEPSAGMGHIADRIREAGVEPDVVELAVDRRELLEAKGYNLVGNDFMDVDGKYDRIIMNPPFGDRRDAEHVQHAYDMLKPGGRLVAIMGEGVFFGSDSKAQAFRNWLDQVGGTSEKLAEGTFLDPSLPVNTGVAARMVVITKETDKGVALFQTGSPAITPLPAKDFDEAVHRLSAGWDAVSRNRIITIDAYSDIPADILAAAEELGYPTNEIKGFVYQGNAYLVRPNIGTVAEVEEALLHEALGHLGTFAVLGKAAIPVMNEFWLRAGGTKGVLKIARQYGIEKEISAVTDTVMGLEKTALAKKRAAIVNELIAHAQTTGDTAKAIKWVLGKIKQALQTFAEQHNWNWLADKLGGFSDLDLAVFMRQAKDAIITGKTPEGTEVSFMVAWHGSPHDHDKFDIEYVGAGEGNQAYGHGLYFAGSKEVAEWYRAALSRDNLSAAAFSKDGVTLRGDEILPEYFKPGRIVNGYGGQDEVLEFRKDVPYQGAWSVKVSDIKDAAKYGKQQPRWHRTTPSLENVEKALAAEGWSVSKGRLYQVELAPSEDEYLLWDKPLSEQSEKVKAALVKDEQAKIDKIREQRIAARDKLSKSGGDVTALDRQIELLNEDVDASQLGGSGESFYRAAQNRLGSQQAASEYLRSLGIRGIRYLDGSSRMAVHRVSDTVFDVVDQRNNIIARDFKTRSEASQYIDSRGNYNYVIFDDKDIEILSVNEPTRAYGSLDFTAQQAQDIQQGARRGQTESTATGEGNRVQPIGRAGQVVHTTVGGKPAAEGWAGTTRASRNGSPITLYRGSGVPLQESHFNLNALGKTSQNPSSGLGVWLTTGETEASGYGDVVEKFHLHIRNPKVIRVENLHGFESVEDAHAYREKLRAAGHDGIAIDARHLGKANVHFVAFEPHQVIYPADLSVEQPQVMYSRQPSIPDMAQPPAQPPRQGNISLQGGQSGSRASWDSPEPSFFDDVLYKLQDKNIDLKRVTQAIRDAGVQLSEKWDAYLQEELFHGRAAKRVHDFVDTELKPLMTEMKMRGQTLAELDQFLHARHAKEANALIAERNPDMPDGGSGMTNQEADDYFTSLPADKRKRLEATAKRVDAIIAKTREYYASYGLVSRDTVTGWADMFEHYVPLMREDHDGYMGIGQGFSIKGKEVKHRTGSTAKVVDILANIAMQREKAIVRGEKNRVAVALAGLAKLNPSPGFWTFDKVPTERVLNEKTGLVEERIDPTFKSKPNVVVAKIKDSNGNIHERAVIFEKHNERAMRMAEAMKNLDASQLNGVLSVSAKITRYFASINTQYNPVFGVTNLVRDVQGAALNLTSTPLAGKQKEVLGHILSAAKGIYLDARAERKGAPATSKWAGLWEELQDEGGMTGYRDLYRTSEDRAKAIEHELDPHNWVNSKWGKVFTANGTLKVPLTKAQDMASPIFDWLSDYNLMMEGATRLSIYKTAIDHGMTKRAAASLAKNTTVNFNRKGQSGQQAGALYAFFNAAMQGTARMGQTVFDMEKGDIKTLRLSKTGQKIVYGGMLLGVMQALALAAAGFDDDEPPEFIRERSLIIPIGGKKYISIPMPLGFHVLPNLGRIPTEFAMGGFKNPAEQVIKLMGVFAEAFNPIGSAGISMQTIAPTALDPFAALAENRDWTGKPIYKEDFNSMKPTPGFTRNKDTASVWSKFIAEGINLVSGGTDYTPGAFSPTADQIDYLIGQVTGGVGRETSKAFQTGEALITGESLPTHKIPLVGRFYGDSENQSSQGNKYYANLKEINLIEMELKGRREDHLPTDEFRKENPKAQLIARAKYADKIISKLRKQKRELIEKGVERERVRQVEERITAEMLRFNTAVDKFEARTP